jgi:hypothetical protein
MSNKGTIFKARERNAKEFFGEFRESKATTYVYPRFGNYCLFFAVLLWFTSDFSRVISFCVLVVKKEFFVILNSIRLLTSPIPGQHSIQVEIDGVSVGIPRDSHNEDEEREGERHPKQKRAIPRSHRCCRCKTIVASNVNFE